MREEVVLPRLLPLAFLATVALAVLLELFDFPPELGSNHKKHCDYL